MRRDTRTAIVHAVLELFEERASLTFTFEELARRAGVARQTVYSNFADRAALFVAVADFTRSQLDGSKLAAAVFDAPTARDALTATVDFHMQYTMRILGSYRAIEIERAKDPAVARAFEARDVGRVRTVHHVMTRLKAEGQLDPAWTVESATDLMSGLLSAALSAELCEQRGWTHVEFRERLLLTLRRTFLIDDRATRILNIETTKGHEHAHQPL